MSSISDFRILLAGASGLTGQAVLRLLLTDERVKEVHTPLRGPPRILHPKLHPHPWQSQAPRFQHLPSIPFDAVLCCLGTTIKKAGTREAFRDIDRDAVQDLGQWTKDRGISRFIVVSSAGADSRSLSFYLRTKGEMEEGLQKLGIAATSILRPGLLLGEREELRPAERLSQWLLPILGYRGMPVDTLARFMISKIFDSQTGFQIVENREILNQDLKRS